MSHHKTAVNSSIKGAKAPATFNEMSPKMNLKRSPSPVAMGRSSFSSIRERDSDLAQTFTSTKISSYSSHNLHQLADEVAVADELSAPATPMLVSSRGPLPLPGRRWSIRSSASSEAEGECLRDDAAQSVAQSVARSLEWLNDEAPAPMDLEPVPAARQPFETLPFEIHRLIVEHLILDTPPNGVDRRNVDLMSLLVTSRALYEKTLEAIYRRVVVPHSRNFQKFLATLVADPARGEWVRRLDFSHFSPVVLFSTASKRKAAQNLTAATLAQCLQRTPNLREFLAQDYIDGDIDEAVLQLLLTGLPHLTALDLCGCSALSFRDAFSALVAGRAADAASPVRWPEQLPIQRLSLHKCTSLPSEVFEAVLPKLHRLTHLDLAGTSVTNAALKSIPATARITHLNLAKCSLLTADAVIDFLANHPAVNQNSLVFLSLGFNASTAQLLGEDDVSRLLPILPETLRSLSLKGSSMSRAHVPQLRKLAKHLEELAVGRNLDPAAVSALVVPPKQTNGGNNDWVPHSLRYLDLTDMDAETLDLSFLYLDSHLLDPITGPLEVIELSDNVFKRVSKTKGPLNRMGWRPSEIGARSWLVRDSNPAAAKAVASTTGSFAMENGQRPWKMGAQSWGMRKIPVAHAKVGGMYGSYMFGRAL